MDKDIVAGMDRENAEALCAKIEQDAQAEVEKLLERARADAQAILARAREEARVQQEAASHELDKEVEKDRDRIASTLNLEKKRLVLDGKQAFVERVIAQVRQRADRFRGEAAYGDFLARCVVEGLLVLDAASAVVYYAAADEHIFTADFIRALSDRCSAAVNKTCVLRFNKSEFKDLGVIVNSLDGRMMFDNRFSARLARMYDGIYMELLKEAV